MLNSVDFVIEKGGKVISRLSRVTSSLVAGYLGVGDVLLLYIRCTVRKFFGSTCPCMKRELLSPLLT